MECRKLSEDFSADIFNRDQKCDYKWNVKN